MLVPSRSCASLCIHHPMTRQLLCPWGISEYPSHHPRMTRPTRQGCYMPVSRHSATRNLTDNSKHLCLKRSRFLCCHPIRIVMHLLLSYSTVEIAIFSFGYKHSQACDVSNDIFRLSTDAELASPNAETAGNVVAGSTALVRTKSTLIEVVGNP